jgi:DNA invertase Pin-like site-specific DNA recombinase
MKASRISCAIYTRKSSEDGLEQDFNSLDAQREACAAYILSQKSQGWVAVPTSYDDGGISGGTLERPGLQQLMIDIRAQKVQVVVVYKVDRLTRSLADFSKLVELFDQFNVSFVSITQQFNTTSSMGRLTLNMLLSFAQFEREVTGERIRDKIAASKRKGMWMGGLVPMGYKANGRTLEIKEDTAEKVREIYRMYLDIGNVSRLKEHLDQMGWQTPERHSVRQGQHGNRPFSRGHLYRILSNPVYIGKIPHKTEVYEGQHPGIISPEIRQAVRETMESHLKGVRSGVNNAWPSLLIGLLVDAKGRRLTPVHTKKNGRIYRYYSSPMDIDNKDPDKIRVSANELDEAVLTGMKTFLKDEARLLRFLDDENSNQFHELLQTAQQLHATLNAPDRELMQRCVQSIEVTRTRLWVRFKASSLGLDLKDETQDETSLIEIPVLLKRCGLAMKLIMYPDTVRATRKKDTTTMIALLAKATDWFNRLKSGECKSISALAEEDGSTAPYICKVIQLAFLSPEILNRILVGEHPPELNAQQLFKKLPLSLNWAEQGKALGFNL